MTTPPGPKSSARVFARSPETSSYCERRQVVGVARCRIMITDVDSTKTMPARPPIKLIPATGPAGSPSVRIHRPPTGVTSAATAATTPVQVGSTVERKMTTAAAPKKSVDAHAMHTRRSRRVETDERSDAVNGDAAFGDESTNEPGCYTEPGGDVIDSKKRGRQGGSIPISDTLLTETPRSRRWCSRQCRPAPTRFVASGAMGLLPSSNPRPPQEARWPDPDAATAAPGPALRALAST